MGCDGGSKGINIETRDMGPACAAYTACLGKYGMSHCVGNLELLRHYDIGNSTLMLAQLYLFVDWVDMLSLAQNIKCVVSARGDCDKVLACMNRGVKVTDCTPSEDHDRGYYCADDKKLAKCMQVVDGPFTTTVEISVNCSSLGLKCAEMPVDIGNPWIACVNEKVDVTDGIEVTCDGTVASVTFNGGVMREDCKTRGGPALREVTPTSIRLKSMHSATLRHATAAPLWIIARGTIGSIAPMTNKYPCLVTNSGWYAVRRPLIQPCELLAHIQAAKFSSPTKPAMEIRSLIVGRRATDRSPAWIWDS